MSRRDWKKWFGSSWSGSVGEWVKRRLGDIVALRRGFDLPKRLRVQGPYPVLSSGVTAGWHSEGPVEGPGFVVGRATNLVDLEQLRLLFKTLDLTGFDSGSVQP